MVGPGAGGTVDQPGLGVLYPAHQAVVLPGRLVDTLVAVPKDQKMLNLDQNLSLVNVGSENFGLL